jgi:hypothetical protein
MRMLQEGAEGFAEELLYSEMEEEDERYSRQVVAAALQKLVKGKYFSSSPSSSKHNVKLSIAVENIPGARLMNVEVEKVLQGGAVVVLDDKWYARLEATDYSGPRDLIKKGKSFKAVCELYDSSGVLNVNVRQVVQAGLDRWMILTTLPSMIVG